MLLLAVFQLQIKEKNFLSGKLFSSFMDWCEKACQTRNSQKNFLPSENIFGNRQTKRPNKTTKKPKKNFLSSKKFFLLKQSLPFSTNFTEGIPIKTHHGVRTWDRLIVSGARRKAIRQIGSPPCLEVKEKCRNPPTKQKPKRKPRTPNAASSQKKLFEARKVFLSFKDLQARTR